MIWSVTGLISFRMGASDILPETITAIPILFIGFSTSAFLTAAELVVALREFKRLYKAGWLIERHDSRAPSQVRRASLDPALPVT
mgnify:FL=1